MPLLLLGLLLMFTLLFCSPTVEPAISLCLSREIAHLVGFKVHPLPQEEQTRGTMLECSIGQSTPLFSSSSPLFSSSPSPLFSSSPSPLYSFSLSCAHMSEYPIIMGETINLFQQCTFRFCFSQFFSLVLRFDFLQLRFV